MSSKPIWTTRQQADWPWAASTKKVLDNRFGRNQAESVCGAGDPELGTVSSNSDICSPDHCPMSQVHLLTASFAGSTGCLTGISDWSNTKLSISPPNECFLMATFLYDFFRLLRTNTWEWSFHSSLWLIALQPNPNHLQIQFLYLQQNLESNLFFPFLLLAHQITAAPHPILPFLFLYH